MALDVVHDGSKPGDVAENCCMCRKTTRYWWGTGKFNVALCPECAKTAREKDLPTKAEWIAKERLLNKSLSCKTFGWN